MCMSPSSLSIRSEFFEIVRVICGGTIFLWSSRDDILVKPAVVLGWTVQHF